MAFPDTDAFWAETADFVARHAREGEAILAPEIFWWRLGRVHAYEHATLHPDAAYDWAVLHKGDLERLPRSLVERIRARDAAVFANAVFVVFAAGADLPALPAACADLIAFDERLAAHGECAPSPGAARVAPQPGITEPFAAFTRDELRDAMNAFWRNGGYRYETRRDQAYYAEIDRVTRGFLERARPARLLDLCCGVGRLGDMAALFGEAEGLDISDVAIEQARARHTGNPRVRFLQGDAHATGFAAGSFDTVLLVDSIEHVHDAVAVIVEAARVLRPGGRLLLTAANTESLHLVMARKLGYAAFATNYQHIREFNLADVRAMLEGAGLTPIQAEGIFLFPYWGVPGLDEAVRALTDDDPEVVELLRKLGAAAGPEHAFTFVVEAQKR